VGKVWRLTVVSFNEACRYRQMAFPMTSRSFSFLGLRSILVLGNGISGFAKSNEQSLGEMNTFLVTFRDLVPLPSRFIPRRAGMLAVDLTPGRYISLTSPVNCGRVSHCIIVPS